MVLSWDKVNKSRMMHLNSHQMRRVELAPLAKKIQILLPLILQMTPSGFWGRRKARKSQLQARTGINYLVDVVDWSKAKSASDNPISVQIGRNLNLWTLMPNWWRQRTHPILSRMYFYLVKPSTARHTQLCRFSGTNYRPLK